MAGSESQGVLFDADTTPEGGLQDQSELDLAKIYECWYTDPRNCYTKRLAERDLIQCIEVGMIDQATAVEVMVWLEENS